MDAARITPLSGNRLHLHHGPIDLILWIDGPGRNAALARAIARFNGILAELVSELPELRRPGPSMLHGPVARAMHKAVTPFQPDFVTPMAAVAGAVADAVLLAAGTDGIDRAYANNGGDIALYLAPGQTLTCAIANPLGPPTQVRVRHADPVRGIATSGWRGRSHSLGIADCVTVLAKTAAKADAAATMIANRVDCPGHPGIVRRPARDLQADSDLGATPVTTGVTGLANSDIRRALDLGAFYARSLIPGNHIAGAALFLHSDIRTVGHFPALQEPALV